MSDWWDVALTGLDAKRPECKITFPVPLSKALTERGYNRAILTVTDDGLLIAPYVGPTRRGRHNDPVPALPDWKKGKK